MKKIITLIISILFISLHTLLAQVDINSASAKELSKNVKGLGKVLAERIVEYREMNGLFMSVDDLTKVKGIGKKSLEKIKDELIAVQPEEEEKEETKDN